MMARIEEAGDVYIPELDPSWLTAKDVVGEGGFSDRRSIVRI